MRAKNNNFFIAMNLRFENNPDLFHYCFFGILLAFFQRVLKIWFTYLKIRKYCLCCSHFNQLMKEKYGQKCQNIRRKQKITINVDPCYCDQFRMTYPLAVYCPIKLHQNRNTFCHLNYRHSQIRSGCFHGRGQF